MSYFEPETWRAFTRDEMLAQLSKFREKTYETIERAEENKDSPTRKALILQNTVSPLDAYTYLRARFGQPNGMQTFLAKDDSDNLFHWDYYVKAGSQTVTFTGATQEVHVWLEEELTDDQWLDFIENLKKDFGRVGKEKSAILSSLEKWSIFPNQYLSIANRCADLHHDLTTALPTLKKLLFKSGLRANDPSFPTLAKRQGKLMTKVTTASTELTILMPVMFESFLGLLIACLIKPELKRNRRMFETFIRSALDVKLMDLANRCNGFKRPILDDNDVFRRFWHVVNKRNDIIHGNIDPVRNSLDIVYFDGKRPLYRTGGDRIVSFWKGLIDQYKPDEVVADYILTHEFIGEILDHLAPPVRAGIQQIMADTQPGWDDKRKIFGTLFPGHLSTVFFGGLRYDSDLRRAIA